MKMEMDKLKGLIKEVVKDTFAEQEFEQNSKPFADGKAMAAAIAKHMGSMAKVAVSENDVRGRTAARFVRGIAASKGDPDKLQKWLEKNHGDDEVLKALTVSSEDGTDFIMPDTVSNELIELLRPMSAIRRLSPIVLPMATSNFQIPKLVAGSSASYIGSDDDIPSTKPRFGMIQMSFKKLAAIVPISNDLIRYSSPGADDVVRDDLVAAIAQREDQAFIRDDGSESTPKGLRYWVNSDNVFAANGTVNLANVTSDLASAILKLMEADSRMLRPAWVFAPRTMMYLMSVRDGNGNYAFRDEMLRGTLWGYPFTTTNNIPINLGGGSDESELYFADFADVVIGESMQLRLDASQEASYTESGSTVSSFQRDQTVIRAIVEHDLALRHDKSVSVITGVTWTP